EGLIPSFSCIAPSAADEIVEGSQSLVLSDGKGRLLSLAQRTEPARWCGHRVCGLTNRAYAACWSGHRPERWLSLGVPPAVAAPARQHHALVRLNPTETRTSGAPLCIERRWAPTRPGGGPGSGAPHSPLLWKTRWGALGIRSGAERSALHLGEPQLEV